MSEKTTVLSTNFFEKFQQFIERVGFPILAFVLMFAFATQSLQKMQDAMNKITESLAENTAAMREISATNKTFQDEVRRENKKMCDIQEIILEKVK